MPPAAPLSYAAIWKVVAGLLRLTNLPPVGKPMVGLLKVAGKDNRKSTRFWKSAKPPETVGLGAASIAEVVPNGFVGPGKPTSAAEATTSWLNPVTVSGLEVARNEIVPPLRASVPVPI